MHKTEDGIRSMEGSSKSKTRTGFKLDLNKIKFKGISNALKANLQEKVASGISCKDFKSTGRSRIRDYDSDSEMHSFRYNTKEN